MTSDGELRAVSATRNAEGSYIETLLGKLAQAERDVEWYRAAYQQAEKEIDRMTRQLQHAFEQGFSLDDEDGSEPHPNKTPPATPKTATDFEQQAARMRDLLTRKPSTSTPASKDGDFIYRVL